MNYNKIINGFTTCLIIILSGCATHPDKIPSQYISPLQYDSYTCKQIAAEMQRVTARVSEVGGSQAKSANNDKIKMGVGLVLFWPTLFFLDGHSQQASEYSRLKGEFDALTQAAIQKNCGFNVQSK